VRWAYSSDEKEYIKKLWEGNLLEDQEDSRITFRWINGRHTEQSVTLLPHVLQLSNVSISSTILIFLSPELNCFHQPDLLSYQHYTKKYFCTRYSIFRRLWLSDVIISKKILSSLL